MIKTVAYVLALVLVLAAGCGTDARAGGPANSSRVPISDVSTTTTAPVVFAEWAASVEEHFERRAFGLASVPDAVAVDPRSIDDPVLAAQLTVDQMGRVVKQHRTSFPLPAPGPIAPMVASYLDAVTSLEARLAESSSLDEAIDAEAVAAEACANLQLVIVEAGGPPVDCVGSSDIRSTMETGRLAAADPFDYAVDGGVIRITTKSSIGAFEENGALVLELADGLTFAPVPPLADPAGEIEAQAIEVLDSGVSSYAGLDVRYWDVSSKGPPALLSDGRRVGPDQFARLRYLDVGNVTVVVVLRTSAGSSPSSSLDGLEERYSVEIVE